MTPDSKAAMEKAIDILRRVPCTLDEQCQTCAAAEQIRIAMKSPPSQESHEVSELVDAARLVANQFLFSPDKGMESFDDYALAHERLNAAVAAIKSQGGVG